MRRRAKQLISVTLYVVGLVSGVTISRWYAWHVYYREKAKCDAIGAAMLAGDYHRYICAYPIVMK